VGNMFFPLLEEDKDLFVHACDFSPRAIQFIKVRKWVELHSRRHLLKRRTESRWCCCHQCFA
jgi:hypothetical protein